MKCSYATARRGGSVLKMFMPMDSMISTIYFIQKLVAATIVISLILASINVDNRYLKTSSLIVLLALTVMHYCILFMISGFEKVFIYPFIVIEAINDFSSMSIDIGQITIITLLWMWRNRIKSSLTHFIRILRHYKVIR